MGDADRSAAIARRLEAWGSVERDNAVCRNVSGFLAYVETYVHGRYDRARAQLARALACGRGFHQKWADAELDLVLGKLEFHFGQNEEATKALRAALRYLESNQWYRPQIDLALGRIHLSAGRPSEAILHLQEALKRLNEEDVLFQKSQTAFYLGQAQRRLGQRREASNSFDLSIRTMYQPSIVWRAYVELAQMAQEDGDDQEALRHYFQAISVVETLREKLTDPARKARFLAGVSGVYEATIRLLLRLGRVSEAMHYLERARATQMLDMLRGKAFSSGDPQKQALLEQERSLGKSLQAAYAEGAGRDSMTTGQGDEGTSLLEEWKARYRGVLEGIRELDPELASLITVNPLKAEEIQTLLDGDVALLEYFTASDKTYAWLVTKEGIRVYEIGVPEKELKEKVDRLLLPNISNRPRKAEPMILQVDREEKETGEGEREENRQRFQAVAKELYEAILAPVSKDIKTKNLIVVPYGVLHKVPSGALTDGSSYLIDRYTVSVLPWASVLAYVVKKRKGEKDKALVLANPKTEYIPVGHAEVEGRMLESLFTKPEAYYRERATETTAKQRMSDFNVIHFATHGEFNELQPMQSGLLLTKDGENDGYLQVHETFDLDLKNANLVTLSACETALSKVQGGDDLVGLSRGFIYAGTPSILATLWKVDDASTAKLMEIFYRNWKSGMSKAEALRQAQESVKGMKGYEHPYYWAPFVMIGDWK
jgi:CHAT domain-containing protein/tetratricopeptide (TPR) repeat protein